MKDLLDSLAALVRDRNLFALDGEVKLTRSDHVHGHLLAPIILLATRDDVLAKVFPADGTVNPKPLRDRGVDSKLVSDEKVKKLAKYRLAFASLQVAWLELSGYEQPPCLDNPRMDRLIDFTKTLHPKTPARPRKAGPRRK